MKDLFKRLFSTKRDYVKIINKPIIEDELNEFFEEVNKEGGKIVSIKNILEINGHTEYNDGQYAPVNTNNLVSIDSYNQIIIHYKCYEKVDYISKRESDNLERLERDKIAYLKKKSKQAVENLVKEHNKRAHISYKKTPQKENFDILKENENSQDKKDDLPF